MGLPVFTLLDSLGSDLGLAEQASGQCSHIYRLPVLVKPLPAFPGVSVLFPAKFFMAIKVSDHHYPTLLAPFLDR